MRLLLVALVGLVACQNENQLHKNENNNNHTDDTDSGDVDTAQVQEDCNGLDDDGDGDVDEGFPDEDGNGRADCQDGECPPIDLGEAGAVEIVEECLGTVGDGGEEVVDPWDVDILWQIGAPTGAPSAINSYSQPVVGNLDDDNGDGLIDESDDPDVVMLAFGGSPYSVVVALDGATGADKWVSAGGNLGVSVSIADVDVDGAPDVVTFDTSRYLQVFEGDGSLKYTSTTAVSSAYYPLAVIADLDEDGLPEVVGDEIVFNGEDGSVDFSLTGACGSTNPYRIAAVADADRDGDQEIFLCGKAYDSDGTLLWSTGEIGTYGFWPIIVQADSDDDAEIGFVGQNWSLWDHDGTEIYKTSYGTPAQPGPPCAGDFDGDGVAEVAWPSYMNFVVYELSGTEAWSSPMDDTSGLAGCSGYDVNNDGALEILFADQTSFTIFDGSTGDELYTNPGHRSGTVFEYPSVADIDNDDAAEIVITSNYWTGSWGVITAFEHAGDGWPASGKTWAGHDFHITNINADGSVPPTPDYGWLKYNVYRSRVAADDPSTPDLVPEFTEVCVHDCEYGPATVGVQTMNQGGADVSAGVLLSLFGGSGSDEWLIGTQALPEIEAGQRPVGVQFDVAFNLIGDRFIARVDDDGSGNGDVNECHEDNNEAVHATDCD